MRYVSILISNTSFFVKDNNISIGDKKPSIKIIRLIRFYNGRFFICKILKMKQPTEEKKSQNWL